jgi:hypothetical protein
MIFGLAYIVAGNTCFAAECGLKQAFNQVDDDGHSQVRVWDQGQGQPLLFGGSLHVNTDGTRRSYNVTDFWGVDTAVNNLCNAMSDKCADMSEAQLHDRRVLTQDARAKGWPKDMLAQTKISPSIIPLVDGKPCPEVGGYLVSATALQDPAVKDVCSFAKYADAMKVSAIVLPGRLKKKVPTGFETRDAKVGDLVAVLTGDGSRVVFAVVGDTGPSKELGEGTIALAGTLLGKTSEPANYLEVRGKKPFIGKGWDVRSSFTLLFPGTRDTAKPYLTQDRIDKAAADALTKWGGIERLKACRVAYNGG